MSDDSDYQRMARLIMNSGKKPQTEPLTSDASTCEAIRRSDGQPRGKPVKYRLLPLRSTEVARDICGKHARHYDKKWLVKL